MFQTPHPRPSFKTVSREIGHARKVIFLQIKDEGVSGSWWGGVGEE